MLRALALAACAAAASAAVAGDLVTSLPGFGAPLTTTYSGYLAIPGGKALHYLLYTSQTGKASDPLILWFNGGPGCSSLEGAFQESGPLWTAPGGQGLQLNNYSWNKFAHHLFLEAPACVGFSTADKLSGCTHNDTGTAADNLAALIKFFSLYPEYVNNDFWITGESYAGIYVPSLAYDIVQYNAGGSGQKIALKGIAVGNGCLGDNVGICGGAPYGDYLSALQLYGHSFISNSAWAKVTAECPTTESGWNNPSTACMNALNAAGNEAGGNFDVYDIYSGAWGICNYGSLQGQPPRKLKEIMRRPVRPGSITSKLLAAASNQCTDDSDLTTYMNLPAVQAALHVKNPLGGWQECANIDYTPNIADERTVIYPALLQAGLSVHIYNGDADACVPHTDNEWWTASMAYPVKTAWHPWTASDGTLGGYSVTYTPPAGQFTYTTIRLAGHMVPQTQPLYAYDLIYSFVIKGQPL